MTQVSRRLVNKRIEERILSLFLAAIVLAQDKNLAASFIEDLLTPTEKVMLAKRFSIAFMLLEGYKYEVIEGTLKVSRATVGSVALWLKHKGEGIRKVREKIKRNEAMGKIWKEIKEGIVEILTGSKKVLRPPLSQRIEKPY